MSMKSRRKWERRGNRVINLSVGDSPNRAAEYISRFHRNDKLMAAVIAIGASRRATV